MEKLRIILLLSALLSYGSYSLAQDHKPETKDAKNVIGANVGFYFGGYYERQLASYLDRNFTFMLRAEIGGAAFPFIGTYNTQSVKLVTVLNGGNNHMDLETGILLFKDRLYESASTGSKFTYGIGYRYQKSEGGLSLRIGINMPESIRLGIGWAF